MCAIGGPVAYSVHCINSVVNFNFSPSTLEDVGYYRIQISSTYSCDMDQDKTFLNTRKVITEPHRKNPWGFMPLNN